MGRPPACDCRCGGDEPPEPPVTDCENLLCVCLIDENSPGIPDAKMQGFIDAFPNRVLIVLDVTPGCCGTMNYTTKFINYNRAFSLRLEHATDSTNLIQYIQRDGGRQSVADSNDPWGRIKEIISRNGLQTWFDNDNKEVSIFVDNSGSMRTSDVTATLAKLETDLQYDGKTRVESIYNGSEDIICPFVVSECCTGQAAENLAALCGYTWDCPEFVEIYFANPPIPYLDYQVKIVEYNQVYEPGDVVVVEAGTELTFELVGFSGGGGAVGESYGPWRGRNPGTKVDPSDYGDYPLELGATCPVSPFTNKCICPLTYTIQSGGLDIWAPVSQIFV